MLYKGNELVGRGGWNLAQADTANSLPIDLRGDCHESIAL